MATSGDYAPFSFPAPAAAGEPAIPFDGFDVEVASMFARERGYRLEFVPFRWPDLSRELAAGNFDVAMSGVTMRPERSIAGRFSVPVAATHAVALTWKGSGATNLQELDLPTRRIAVNAGGHLEKVARQVFRRAGIVPIPDNEAVRMALLDRSFDAVVTDNYEEKVWTAPARDAVRIAPLSDDRKAYLLPADRAGLAAELDRWLLAREKDGTLAKLRGRYFQEDAASTSGAASHKAAVATAEPLAALAAAVVERLALMPMVYEAKKQDGKSIEDKAQEAAVLDGAVRAVASEVEAHAASRAGAGSDTVATADGPGAAGPDTEAVRSLFEALIAIGKDAQQKLADVDARSRPGVVQHRPTASSAAPGTAPAGAGAPASSLPPSATPSAAGSPAAGEPATVSRPHVYDLAGEVRPAIGRITAKIACILVAMDEPISSAEARRELGNALASHDVRSEHIDAMAAAVARISSRE